MCSEKGKYWHRGWQGRGVQRCIKITDTRPPPCAYMRRKRYAIYYVCCKSRTYAKYLHFRFPRRELQSSPTLQGERRPKLKGVLLLRSFLVESLLFFRRGNTQAATNMACNSVISQGGGGGGRERNAGFGRNENFYRRFSPRTHAAAEKKYTQIFNLTVFLFSLLFSHAARRRMIWKTREPQRRRRQVFLISHTFILFVKLDVLTEYFNFPNRSRHWSSSWSPSTRSASTSCGRSTTWRQRS